VAATNRDLSAAVSSGGFRADLYSRIRVLSIHLPPLGQRREDIALLTEHFLRSLPVEKIEHKAIYAMLTYAWPANARELRNVLVEAAAAAATDGKKAIRLRHLRAEVQGLEKTATSGKPDERISAVIEALKTHKGNVARAAEELGLHRAQIYKALRAAGIKASQFRDE
jgi:transcriptional regulator of acetoin/glycerol metabolism